MLANQLNDIVSGLGSLGFELVLGAGALILLVVGLVSKKVVVSQAVFVLIIFGALWTLDFQAETTFLFGDALEINSLATIIKLLFGIATIWVVFFPSAKNNVSEVYFIMLAIMLASSLMLGANNLLVIYLSVELASFGGYILTNFNFKRQSFEAGIKYLLFGGVSSAMALYGASLLYGYTGTLTLSEMNFTIVGDPMLFNVGLILFVGALLFKVSVVPFHIWVPSTYQEAPTDTVFLLSVVPKVAGFVLLHRILLAAQMQETYWLYLTMIVLGIGTIAIGTLAAIGQANIKRLIAYGAIAHSGFLLGALLVPFDNGVVAFTWYAFVYAGMNLAVFYLVSVFEQNNIADLKDLAGGSNAFVGGLLTVIVISLIGLPPTAGFTIKFYLFTVIWEQFQSVGDLALLVFLIVAIISVVISLFIYLKLPYFYFLKENEKGSILNISVTQKLLATIFTIVLLWIFLDPEILNNIAVKIKSIGW